MYAGGWKSILESNQGSVFSLVSTAYREIQKPDGEKDQVGTRYITAEPLAPIEGHLAFINGQLMRSSFITIGKWMEENYPQELNHCRNNHIWSTLQWRNKPIWQGNYWENREIRIKETSNPAGNNILLYSADMKLLASVKETIFIKIGSDDQLKPILQILVSTAVGAMAGVATGSLGTAAGATLGASIAKGTVKGAIGGAIKAGIQKVWQTEHYQQEYTIEEFQQTWVDSGIYPLKMTLEQNNELINRYLANRKLKRSVETNQYFNAVNFGAYFERGGFNKFKFHSLNMYSLIDSGESKEWFKKQLEEGVQIIKSEKDLLDWYKTEMPKRKIISTNVNVTGNLDVMIIEDKSQDLVISDIKEAQYGNDDFIGSPDNNIWETLNRANNNVHPGTSPFNNNCLGCLCGGGSHGDPNYNFERIYNFTSGGKLVLKTKGSGLKECTIPPEGGKVIFSAKGDSAKITLVTFRAISRNISNPTPYNWGQTPISNNYANSGIPTGVTNQL
jgi:hypothetical protein